MTAPGRVRGLAVVTPGLSPDQMATLFQPLSRSTTFDLAPGALQDVVLVDPPAGEQFIVRAQITARALPLNDAFSSLARIVAVQRNLADTLCVLASHLNSFVVGGGPALVNLNVSAFGAGPLVARCDNVANPASARFTVSWEFLGTQP